MGGSVRQAPCPLKPLESHRRGCGRPLALGRAARRHDISVAAPIRRSRTAGAGFPSRDARRTSTAGRGSGGGSASRLRGIISTTRPRIETRARRVSSIRRLRLASRRAHPWPRRRPYIRPSCPRGRRADVAAPAYQGTSIAGLSKYSSAPLKAGHLLPRSARASTTVSNSSAGRNPRSANERISPAASAAVRRAMPTRRSSA